MFALQKFLLMPLVSKINECDEKNGVTPVEKKTATEPSSGLVGENDLTASV